MTDCRVSGLDGRKGKKRSPYIMCDDVIHAYHVAMRTGAHWTRDKELLWALQEKAKDGDSDIRAFRAQIIKDQADWRRMKVGDQIEGRVQNDSLYYSGVVEAFSDDRRTIVVKYEDGETDTVPHQWVRPFRRRTIWKGEDVFITQGRYAKGGLPCDALFLRFVNAPQLYQSAILVQNDDASTDSIFIPFEVNQAMMLVLPLLHRDFNGRTESNGHGRDVDNVALSDISFRFAVIGCGGGVIPMGLASLCPRAILDVVDLNKEVLFAASTFFGVKETPRTRLHMQDGAVFLKSMRPETFDSIILDVAACDAVDGSALEIPPETFVSETILWKAYHALRPGGIVTINVIATRKWLQKISVRCGHVFGTLNVMVLGLDPNYIFFCRRCHDKGLGNGKSDGDHGTLRDVDVPSLVRAITVCNMQPYVSEILHTFICEAETFTREKCAAGWMCLGAFLVALDDDDYAV